jgi:hypothetical protein
VGDDAEAMRVRLSSRPFMVGLGRLAFDFGVNIDQR